MKQNYHNPYYFALRRSCGLLKRGSTSLALVGLTFLLSHLYCPALAQNSPLPSPGRITSSITGVVTDSRGEVLSGVSITVRGTSVSTATDIGGRYSVLAGNNDVLVFSYISHVTQEIAVQKQSVINVTLSETSASLNDVVVVGYGTQKKSIVTGAISSIKAGDIGNQQIARIEQALQGRTSGVTIASSSGIPGAASTVRIRGNTSLSSGASNPLYVVDGIVVTGGIDYLSSSDIESIEVLKDAASAAIYGARSSAGVILVTTKKGREGSIRVGYNAYYGAQTPAKRLDLLNATQYATLINEQSANDAGAKIYANPESLGEGTNWQNEAFSKNVGIQSHEISISGGNDKSTFYTSFSYFNQEGIVSKEISEYKRYNIRLNSNHKIAKWLTFGQNLGYARIRADEGAVANNNFGGPLSSAINLDPITPLIVTDPAVLATAPYVNQAVVKDEQGNPYGVSSVVQQQMTNPLAYIKTRKGNYSLSDNIVGNLFLEAQPLKGLRLRSTAGVRAAFVGAETFTPIYYLNSTLLNPRTSFSRERQQTFDWNIENTASYNRKVNDHTFEVLLGQGSYLDNNTTGLSVTYYNIPVDNFDDASLNFGTAATDRLSEGFERINHTVSSLFSRLSYNYAEKYLFTGIIRRDGSSRFGPNNKYGYFPSGSLGWVASKEDFWGQNRYVNFLKLRASYGITGNDVLGDFRYLSTVGTGRNYTFGNTYNIGYSPDAPANPDLKWEETSQLNFGVDAVIFENWTLSADWYNKKTVGILQTVVFPAYVGATGSSFGNVADMENKGVELELGYKKRFKVFNIDIRGNVSYLQNRVTYLGENKAFLDGGTTVQSALYPITRIAVGKAINSFYGFKTNGIFQNQAEITNYKGASGGLIQPQAVPGDFRWTDSNGDGAITDADRTFIGDPTPDWSYGMTINASYQNFDLLVFGQGVAGNQIYQAVRRLDIPVANWQTSVLNRWNGEGASNEHPRLTIKDPNRNYSYPSDFRLENGDYFRIKTLQVGYSFPESLTSKVGLQRTRIYISSNNLLTITKYTGFDPEIGGDFYSIDRGIYPQAKSFLVGLNVGF